MYRMLENESVFNEDGRDIDFRVESDTNTHAMFVDAGNSRVAINHSTPLDPLSVHVANNRVLSVRQSTDSAAGVGLSSRNSDATGNLRDISLEGEEVHLSTGQSGGTTTQTRLKITAGGGITAKAEGSDNLRIDLRQGSAKGWASFEQSGTHTIRDSHNLSSISDQGTGISRFSIVNDMNNVNYATVGMSGEQGGGGNRLMGMRGNSIGPNAGQFEIANFALSTQGASDDNRLSIVLFGDIA
jgi:hypothetical protein